MKYKSHNQRRDEILNEYPSIKNLFGPHWITKYICIIHVFIQLYISTIINTFNIYTILFISYFTSLINHNLITLIHECAHNLVFNKYYYNKFFSYFVNLPLVVPMAELYKFYHIKHHKYINLINLDPDYPLKTELYFINKNLCFKLIWIFCYPFFYLFRPTLKFIPKINYYIIINIIIQFLFNFLWIYYFGSISIFYLLINTFLSGTLRPITLHLITEHSHLKQDSISYYGKMNYILLNVGYHLEHHDFCYISWYNLPKIKKIAPKYYENMYKYNNICEVINYILFDKYYKKI